MLIKLLRAYWENKVHVVKEKRGKDSPVYVVTPLEGEGRERVLHRNLLLPCPYLVDGQDTTKQKETCNQKRQVNKQKPKEKSKDNVRHDSDSSSEEGYVLCLPRQAPNARLNPNAPVFRSKVNSPVVDSQTENLLYEEQSQSLDEGDSTELSGQVDERRKEEDTQAQDTDRNQDTDSEGEAAGPVMPEDTETSSEDEHEAEQVRRSTRTRQPKCILTYDTLGKPSFTSLKK